MHLIDWLLLPLIRLVRGYAWLSPPTTAILAVWRSFRTSGGGKVFSTSQTLTFQCQWGYSKRPNFFALVRVHSSGRSTGVWYPASLRRRMCLSKLPQKQEACHIARMSPKTHYRHYRDCCVILLEAWLWCKAAATPQWVQSSHVVENSRFGVECLPLSFNSGLVLKCHLTSFAYMCLTSSC